MENRKIYRFFMVFSLIAFCLHTSAQQKPNVVLIYVDDLGYGDLSSYGATRINTPNVDKIAKEGLIFIDGHCTSAMSLLLEPFQVS